MHTRSTAKHAVSHTPFVREKRKSEDLDDYSTEKSDCKMKNKMSRPNADFDDNSSQDKENKESKSIISRFGFKKKKETETKPSSTPNRGLTLPTRSPRPVLATSSSSSVIKSPAPMQKTPNSRKLFVDPREIAPVALVQRNPQTMELFNECFNATSDTCIDETIARPVAPKKFDNQDKVKKLTAQCASFRQILESVKEERQKFLACCIGLEQSLLTDSRNYQSQLSSSHVQAGRIENELARTKEELSNLQLASVTMKSQLSVTMELKNKLEESTGHIQSEISSLRQHKAVLEERSRRDEVELTKLSAQADRLNEMIVTRERECNLQMDNLRNSLSNETAAGNIQMRNEISCLKVKLEAKEEELSKLALQSSELSENLSRTVAEMNSSTSSAQAAQSLVDSLRVEVERLSETVNTTQSQLRQKETQLNEIMSTWSVMSKSYVETEAGYKDKNSYLEKQVRSLQEELNGLKLGQLQELKNRLEMLSAESSNNNKIIQDISEQLREKEERIYHLDHDLSVQKELKHLCEGREEEERRERIGALSQLMMITNQLEVARKDMEDQKLQFEHQQSQISRQVMADNSSVDMLRLKLSRYEMENSSYQTQILGMQSKLCDCEVQRRKLHEIVQELRGNIRVAVKIRPFLPNESSMEASKLIISPDNCNMSIQGSSLSFNFNHVFESSSTQQDVWEHVKDLVTSSLDGYHVCIMAYGQTGSGKTHTMMGNHLSFDDDTSNSSKGIIPRAVDHICQELSSNSSSTLSLSFYEIYNDNIRDLLNPTSSAISAVEVSNASSLFDHLSEGLKHRSTSSTLLNNSSSRSHCVFHISINRRVDDVMYQGSLMLVDLAGSERTDESGVTGDRMVEACHINKSLTALSTVFLAIGSGSKHVPYRNSKLTQVLQPALSGNGKTMMIATMNPTLEHLHESVSSLRFASNISQIELGKCKRNVSRAEDDSGSEKEEKTTKAVPSRLLAATAASSRSTRRK